MDLEIFWPRLRGDTRAWLIADNGDALGRLVLEDSERVGGPVPVQAWWVGDDGPDGVHLSDAAGDWIEEAANGKVPDPPAGAR